MDESKVSVSGQRTSVEHQRFSKFIVSGESTSGRVYGVVGELHRELIELECPICVAEISLCEVNFGAS